MFGSTRDEWMAADIKGWLAPNRIYPGIADVLKDLIAREEVYIVTTKQVRFKRAAQESSLPRVLCVCNHVS